MIKSEKQPKPDLKDDRGKILNVGVIMNINSMLPVESKDALQVKLCKHDFKPNGTSRIRKYDFVRFYQQDAYVLMKTKFKN